jgi:S-DNA-T family DNA segregation ATPase FtsK/SpoIIIE
MFRHPKAREVAGLLVMAFALLSLVSLISFSPQDPSFFHYASREEAARNFGGLAGAHLAGDFLGILGIAAFLLPPALFWVGFALLSGGSLGVRIVGIVGFVLLVTSTCLLLTMLEHEGFDLSFRGVQPGGFLGGLFFHTLRPVLGHFGLYLMTLTGILLFLVLVSQGSLVGLIRSIREVAAWLGRHTARLFSAARRWVTTASSQKALVPAQEEPHRERPTRTAPPKKVQDGAGETSMRVRRVPRAREEHALPPLSLLDA